VEAKADDTLLNMTLTSAMILFNLAVVYHLEGLQGYDNWCQLSVLKARFLYVKAKTLLDEAGSTDLCSMRDPLLDVLTMALLNNLGQIAHYISEYDSCAQYLHRLTNFLSTVHPRDPRNDNETSAVLEWHKAFFWANVLALKAPTIAPAA
jgi:hypothetical protein